MLCHPKVLSQDSKTQQNSEVQELRILKDWNLPSSFSTQGGEGAKDPLFLTAVSLGIVSVHLVRKGLPLSLFYGTSLIFVKSRVGSYIAATATAREEGLPGYFINSKNKI